MAEKESAVKIEDMSKPSCQLLLTTPMAAIMVSGKDHSAWSGLLALVEPVYTAAAKKTQGEIKETFLTAAHILRGGDASIQPFFVNESLSFDRMMEISATGADFWMCKFSDGEVKKADLVKLFKALQAGLIKVVGDLRDENEMIEELIQVQDRVIEHISSLN